MRCAGLWVVFLLCKSRMNRDNGPGGDDDDNDYGIARYKYTFFQIASPSSHDNGEFKIWRRQRQRQRHRSIIWLVEWRKIIVLHVRHAFWCNVLTKSAKLQREIFIFEVLTTTWARRSKSFILCLYMKNIRAKQVKVHSTYIAQCDHFVWRLTRDWLTTKEMSYLNFVFYVWR